MQQSSWTYPTPCLYCAICRSLTIDLLNENDILFHPNLESLKLSAEGTCQFCLLCWTLVQDRWGAQVVSSCLEGKHPVREGAHWEPSIWLRGQFHHGRLTDHQAGARIWISCGRMPSYPGDPGTNYPDSISSHLAVFASVITRSRRKLHVRIADVAGDEAHPGQQ